MTAIINGNWGVVEAFLSHYQEHPPAADTRVSTWSACISYHRLTGIAMYIVNGCSQQWLSAWRCFYVVETGLVYMAYLSGCWHEFMFLLRLRPYPMKGIGIIARLVPSRVQSKRENACGTLCPPWCTSIHDYTLTYTIQWCTKCMTMLPLHSQLSRFYSSVLAC